MVKRYGLWCVAVLLVFGLQACKHTGESPGTNYASLDDFFKHQSADLQQFVIDPARDTIINGKNGVRLYFSANAFTNMYTGNVITSPVRVSFRQVHTVAEIIFNNKPTQTAHDILETAGCFYLNAHSDLNSSAETSPELEIQQGKVRIDWPSEGKPDEAMQLFNGRMREISTDYFAWDYLSKDKLVADNENNLYSVYPTHLQWINIDKFSKDSTGTRSEISLNLPAGFGSKNTISYMVFRDAETVLSSNKLFFELIPTNNKVTLIAIGVKDSKLYVTEKEITTPAIDTEVSLKMDLTSKAELQDLLNKL